MTDTTTDTTTEPGARSADASMFLSFRFRGERFALGVGCVNEILDPISETRVPRASPMAPALLNVRGAVVPLVDIRNRLGIGPCDDPEDMRILVLDLAVQDENTRLAIKVDAVDEVIEADTTALEAIPELGARWPAEYVEGMARAGDDLVTILNSKTLFDPGFA